MGCPYAALHFSGWFNFVVPARFLYADAASCVQRLGAAAAAATLMPILVLLLSLALFTVQLNAVCGLSLLMRRCYLPLL